MAGQFLTDLITRINSILTGSSFKTEDFVLIDNKTGFNIEELRDLLLNMSDQTKLDSRLQIHAHKVMYFKASARAIKDTFSRFLDQKITMIGEVVVTSKENITRYQDNINVTNNKLTDRWGKHLQSITKLWNATRAELIDTYRLPSSVREMAMAGEEVDALRSGIKNAAAESTLTLLERCKKIALLRLADYAQHMKARIDSATADKLEKLSVETTLLKSAKSAEDVDINPAPALILKASRHLDAANARLLSMEKGMVELSRILEGRLRQGMPLKELNKIVENASKELASDFDTYFEKISVYRSGVFSRRVKDRISKLGIGKELDDLEVDEFQEEEKEQIKNSAVQTLFPGANEFTDTYSGRIRELHGECERMLDTLQGRSSGHPRVPEEFPVRILERDKKALQSTLMKRVDYNVNEVIGKIHEKAEPELKSSVLAYEGRLKTLKKARTKRFALIIVLTGLCAMLCYLGYSHFNQKVVPNTAFWNVTLSLLANFIGWCPGYVIAKLWDKYPKTVIETKKQHLQKMRSTYKSIIESELTDYEGRSLSDDEASQLLYELWVASLVDKPYEIWEDEGGKLLSVLKVAAVGYVKVKREYLKLVDEMTHRSSAFFRDIEHNLRALQEVAQPIKERAIEPSFKLLEGTQLRLESVRKEMDDIQFL